MAFCSVLGLSKGKWTNKHSSNHFQIIVCLSQLAKACWLEWSHIHNTWDPQAWNTDGKWGPFAQASLHVGSAAGGVTEGRRRSGEWYLPMWGWPMVPWVPLLLFWGCLGTSCPFKLLWKIDGGLTFHLEALPFLDLYHSLEFDTKSRWKLWRALLSDGSPACFCFCGVVRLNPPRQSFSEKFVVLSRPGLRERLCAGGLEVRC